MVQAEATLLRQALQGSLGRFKAVELGVDEQSSGLRMRAM
jgi:hypothetical protein